MKTGGNNYDVGKFCKFGKNSNGYYNMDSSDSRDFFVSNVDDKRSVLKFIGAIMQK